MFPISKFPESSNYCLPQIIGKHIVIKTTLKQVLYPNDENKHIIKFAGVFLICFIAVKVPLRFNYGFENMSFTVTKVFGYLSAEQ